MSRRETDPRPVSSGPAPSSPPTPATYSNTVLQAGPPGAHNDEPTRSASIQQTTGSHAPQRFGVHHILNPTAESQQLPAVRSGGDPLDRSPQTGLSPSHAASSEHGSPSAAHPLHPAIGNARRYLTPRSPRAASLSHATPLRGPHPQQQPVFPQHSQGGRAYSTEGSTPEQSPQSAPSQPWSAPMGGPPRLATYSTSPRSVSQPAATGFVSHGQGPHQPKHQPQHQHQHQQGGGVGSRSNSMASLPASPYQHWMPPSDRALVPAQQSGGGGSGPPPATEHFYGLQQQEGQWDSSMGGGPMIQIMPHNGPTMNVQVETYQGSREANEKRQRNAVASARFRVRKKNTEANKDVTIMELQAREQQLQSRVAELEGAYHHYRNDRNRLREIVHMTPAISDQAYRGPPSPIASRPPTLTQGTATPGEPHAGPLEAAAPGYRTPGGDRSGRRSAPEPARGQPRARRRKTDAGPEFTTPNYSASRPGLLPEMPSPSYSSVSSQPGTPLAEHPQGRPPILPPLRMDQPAEHHGHNYQQPPLPGHVQQVQGHMQHAPQGPSTHPPGMLPYRRDTYESGWATTREQHPPPPGR